MFMRAKHSACGEDGIPYAAYKANSLLSAKVLYNCFGDLASGSPTTDLLLSINKLSFSLPKVLLMMMVLLFSEPRTISEPSLVVIAAREFFLGPFHPNWLIPL